MDRFDVKKEGGYEANYNAGWVTTQEDYVVFKGSRAEADIVVKALELLVLEQQKHGLLGISGDRRHIALGNSYYDHQIAHPDSLLGSIRKPNYVADAEVSVKEIEHQNQPRQSGKVGMS